MVDSIGSGLPPSVQAVNKARSNAQSQKSENASSAQGADEVSLSSEAQELSEIDRLASDTREILQSNRNETLASSKASFNELL